MAREQILKNCYELMNDKKLIATADVLKAILAVDKHKQRSFVKYLDEKNEVSFPPTLRIIDSIGGLDRESKRIIDAIDALDEKMLIIVYEILCPQRRVIKVAVDLKGETEIV